MANPQAEDGHIDIANELAEAFAKYFPGHGEGRVLWAILRKTYGWHKKEDHISITQIQNLTGLSRRMVIYCLQNLEKKQMITVIRKRGRGHFNEINGISPQKNYELWVVQEKSSQYSKVLESRKKYHRKSKDRVVQEMGGSARNGKKGLNFLHPQKKLLYYKRKYYVATSNEVRLAVLLFKKIQGNDPKAKKPDFQKWAYQIDLLIRRDRRNPKEIGAVINWCQEDDFWQPNILSAAKLRKQYGTLRGQMKRKPKYGVPDDW